MRRTIRKTFLLEGETVTMRYVKQLCGEERYRRMIEAVLSHAEGLADHLVSAGLTL